MKRFFGALRRFFLPPAEAKTFTRLIPLFAVALIVIVLFAVGTYAWEETNSSVFCGTACHTMPPEYVTYQHSPHTNVSCEDCHMGRDRLPIMVQRKVTYSWQTGSAMVLNTYEYPIYAKNMNPAREACENCHKPEKFSTDTLVEKRKFSSDENNSQTSTYLVVKTGGGSSRQGLGYGIHWHIENPVLFYATDKQQQEIPYVVVQKADGSKVEYVDVEANFDPSAVKPGDLKTMDCITCHNRTAHLVDSPESTMNELMTNGLVSPELPNIKKRGVELLSAKYANEKAAMDAISALKTEYASVASTASTQSGGATMGELADKAVASIQEAWKRTNFVDQKMDWSTHPDNLAHKDFPGCLRCHDGKHLTKDNEGIRLECNLCHSIPVVAGPKELTANLELSKGFEPPSHKNSNWITLHNEVFDDTCAACHTTDDPGGSSNTSFCSNSACHGATWKFAGFDAPKLRAILKEQAAALSTTTPEASTEGPLTFDGSIGAMLTNACGTCHGDAAMKGLNVTTYADLMKGSEDGVVVVAGDPDGSKIVTVQKTGDHPGQFTEDELNKLIEWIKAGAPEK